MILGVGVDIESIERVSRLWQTHRQRAIEVVFTAGEMEEASLCRPFFDGNEEYLAVRFAAKEAAIKVLDPPFHLRYELRDIEVLGHNTLSIRLFGRLDEYAHSKGLNRLSGTSVRRGREVIAAVMGEQEP